MAGCPSGQWERTVNPSALPSKVRILHLPHETGPRSAGAGPHLPPTQVRLRRSAREGSHSETPFCRFVGSHTGSATSGDLTHDGDRDPTLDFGFRKAKVSVGDYVWIDVDRDGLQDGSDIAVPGVVLVLTGPDGKPVTDVFGDPVRPRTTDGKGHYLFSDLPTLPAGQSYTVTIDAEKSAAALKGLIPTSAGAGDDRGQDSSTDSATSASDLSGDGASDLTLDFGFLRPQVSVGDYVWLDKDRDGIQGKKEKTQDVTLPDDGRTTLSKDAGLTATYTDLPVGAACTVTETRTGGATSTTISDEGTAVVDGGTEPATVTVTNQFDLGEVEVTKEIAGKGADEVPDGRTFTIGAACVQDVDGTEVPVALPDGGEQVVSRKAGLVATWSGLPVGTRCTITEPEDGGAVRTTITPEVVEVGGDEVAKVSVVNTFDATPEEPVDPEGPGISDGDDDIDGPVADTGAEVGDSGPDALLVGGLAAALAALIAGAFLVRRQRRV